MPDYQLINPPAFTKKSRTEKFIYVLMFGVPGLPSAPFYVGQTSGLTGRFGSHSMLVWHHAKFGAVARIWVAGSVRTMDADLAEQDLITMLSDAGHLLTNTSITQSRVKKVQAAAGLRVMGAQQVGAYLRSTPKRRGVLTEWTDKWCGTPEYVTQGAQLTREQVTTYVSGLKYPSPAAAKLSYDIAQAHDQKLGFSRMAISGKPHKPLMSLRDIWFFNRAVMTGQPHDFRLTRKRVAAIIRGATPTDQA